MSVVDKSRENRISINDDDTLEQGRPGAHGTWNWSLQNLRREAGEQDVLTDFSGFDAFIIETTVLREKFKSR